MLSEVTEPGLKSPNLLLGLLQYDSFRHNLLRFRPRLHLESAKSFLRICCKISQIPTSFDVCPQDPVPVKGIEPAHGTRSMVSGASFMLGVSVAFACLFMVRYS